MVRYEEDISHDFWRNQPRIRHCRVRSVFPLSLKREIEHRQFGDFETTSRKKKYCNIDGGDFLSAFVSSAVDGPGKNHIYRLATIQLGNQLVDPVRRMDPFLLCLALKPSALGFGAKQGESLDGYIGIV